jgi:hypothetical protein
VAEATAVPRFDSAAFLEVCAGDLTVAVPLLDSVLSKLPEILARLPATPLVPGDADLRRLLHDIKGSVGFLGRCAAMEACSVLERAVQEGGADPARDQLIEELVLLVPILEAQRARLHDA